MRLWNVSFGASGLSALFEDLIGQPLAVDLLSAALARERVAPAYLFAGPEGVGRQLAAVRFLEGLLADGQPSARERRRLLERNHPDLLWLEPTYQHQGRLLTRAEAEEGSAVALRPNCGWSRSATSVVVWRASQWRRSAGWS